MRSKIAAVTAASLLGSVGLAASYAPHANAATPAAAKTVQALKRSTSTFAFTVAGRQHMASVKASAVGTSGAVTLLDNFASAAQGVVEAVSQGGTSLASITLISGYYSAPEIFPAVTYTITVTDAATKATLVPATTFTITPGVDNSEVLYPSAATPTTAVLSAFTDPVTSVPVGQATLSFRNTSSNAVTTGAIDAYVDGVKVASSLAPGQSADVTVPAGDHSVAIYRAGQTSPLPPLFARSVTLTADSYIPLYAIDDSTQTDGFNLVDTPFVQGYQFTASDGGVFNFGGFPFYGSTGGLPLNKPVVGGAESPNQAGYYLVASDGGIFAFGPGADFEGSLGSMKLNKPIVGMAVTDGENGQPGYLLVASDGGVFAFNTPFYGSLGGTTIAAPVVGIAADPTTGQYVIAESNGSLTAFDGTSATVTPTAPLPLNKPIVGITTTPDGGGVWLVASDGGVFNAGDAGFFGSAGGLPLNQPVVGIVSSFDGLGYTLIARDGGVFNYGDSTFYGSTGGQRLNKPVVAGIS